MSSSPACSSWLDVDRFVAAFESAWHEAARHEGGATDLGPFVPAPDHPLHLQVLRELVRVDLEFSWEQGRRRVIDDYTVQFPQLAADDEGLQAMAFEEFRQRARFQDNPDPALYHERFGLPLDDLEELLAMPRLATKRFAGAQSSAGGPNHRADPSLAAEEALNQLPATGEAFLGFRLLAELGRGTFSRVFLAEQGELARRAVVLKIAARFPEEPQTLAQLQHTHIVPIFSLHRAGPLQAVCMPYFGRRTLADWIRARRAEGSTPRSERGRASTLQLANGTATVAAAAAGPCDGRPACPAVQTPVPSAADLSIEQVLRIGMLLADGLAHAHERGILHRDLKPANILLADDGRPMLLDFNLALDTKLTDQERQAVRGGTLPYMSPEQRETLQRNDVAIDARSDLYSFGVVLFEALTARLPPTSDGSASRPGQPGAAASAASVRTWNAEVTPAVEAIVQRCLQADPARRYQSARELYEDLACHLNDQPLRHTANPSWRELARKWVRRHPRLVSMSSVASVAAVLLALLGSAWWLNHQRNLALEATQAAHKLHGEVPIILAHLHSTDGARQQIADGMRLAQQSLQPFAVLTDQHWRDAAPWRRLSEADRRQTLQDVGMVLLLMARAETRPEGAKLQPAKIEQALVWNTQAEAALGPPHRRTVLEQRAGLLEQLGRLEEARSARQDAEAAAVSTGGRFLDLLLAVDNGKYRDSLDFLLDATQKDTRNAVVWLVLGNVYAGLGRHAQAASCYDTALALQPDFFWARFNRGLLHLERRQFAEARQDFQEVIRRRPDAWEAHVNLALAGIELKDHQGAVADLSEALKKGGTATRIYFLRAHAFKQLGKLDDAQNDYHKGMTLEPQDELSCIVRGKERLLADPRAALADFESALKWNPRSRQALQNKAHVLAERLGQTEEAVQVLDRALELYPDYVLARAGRAVLLARLKKSDEAIKDTLKALELEASALTHYQAACVYALAAPKVAENRAKAIVHLEKAIQLDPQWLRIMARDRDLAPLAMEPRFQVLLAASVNLFPPNRPK